MEAAAVIWALWLLTCVLIFPWKARLYPTGCDSMTGLSLSVQCGYRFEPFTPFRYQNLEKCVAMNSLSLVCSLFSIGQYVSEHTHSILSVSSRLPVLIYTLTLCIFSLIGRSRGNRIWTRSVKEASFLSHLPAAPTALPPGTRMRIEDPSPAPSILAYRSMQNLRREFQKMNDYLLHGTRTPGNSSTPRSEPESASIVEVPRAGGHSQAEVARPEKARLRDANLVDYWDPEMEQRKSEWAGSAVSLVSKSVRRLSTVVEESLERKDTVKTTKTTKTGASSSTDTKRQSKMRVRDSDQSFIIFFPCESTICLLKAWF